MFRRAQRRVQPVLESGEAVLTAVRAAPVDEGGSARATAESLGFPVALDNLLLVTNRRILNLSTGFFGRVGHVRGELRLSRLSNAVLGTGLFAGTKVTFTVDGSAPLTFAVRRADGPSALVTTLKEAAVPRSTADDLTPAQKAMNRWARQGWVAIWVPTTANPEGRRRRYWARPGEDRLQRLYAGTTEPPPEPVEPYFYVNDRRVYRDIGHPDGASSVPYFMIRAGRVFPSEGYPTGASDRKLYDIRPIRQTGVAASVRPNPRKRWHP
jgi:hypothetical protein